MPYPLNPNPRVERCQECGQVSGLDANWDFHEHDNLACHWLGKTVEFYLKGIKFIGEVIETQRFYLANGIHDILTVEFWDKGAQIKIQAHRQKFRVQEAQNERQNATRS